MHYRTCGAGRLPLSICCMPLRPAQHAASRIAQRQTRSAHRRHHVSVLAAASAGSSALGLIIETDTCAFDLHNDGHRPAFNRAFQELGLECANWTPRVYHDIRRSGDGSAVGIVKSYFDVVGWPLVVPNSERKIFAEQVVKVKDRMFRQMLAAGDVPLRDGLIKLIDDALEDGAKIGLLCGTASLQQDNVFSSASFALGMQRARHIRYASPWEDDVDEGDVAEPSDQMAAEAAAARNQVRIEEAAALARSMKNIGVDPNVLAASRGLDSSILSNTANRLGVPSHMCALLGATERTLQAGRGAGMLAVSLPTALAGRYKPPSAQLSFDGFGPGGGVTWPRIRTALEEKK